jgi:hypothetical protein
MDHLSDNRDFSLLARFRDVDTNVFTSLRGRQFPLGANSDGKRWLDIYSFTSLIYMQLLGKPTKYACSVENVQDFLVQANLTPVESLPIRVLCVALKRRAEVKVDELELKSYLDELQHITTDIEALLQGKELLFSIELYEKIALLLEAQNAAITLAVVDNMKNWKPLLMKQLKQLRQCTEKAKNSSMQESIQQLKQKYITKTLWALPSVLTSLEYVQRGWDYSTSGILSMIDGKINMLKEIK